jgi:2-polyprenyl-3-methyl-5-hydroxy-6-metoxy-1,4-benzoquinol methylase
MIADAVAPLVESHARLSLGRADEAVHAMVQSIFERCGATNGLLVDVGCGRGNLWRLLRARFSRCIGVDAVDYDGRPADLDFWHADLNGPLPLPDGCADAVAAVEVIEHLEHPRALMRELARITRPGGWVVVTTPNQASALSILTLLFKERFAAFQERDYPAHLTALLPIDLQRIAEECGLRQIGVRFTGYGRLPLTAMHYPRRLAAGLPRLLSDNVAVFGRR